MQRLRRSTKEATEQIFVVFVTPRALDKSESSRRQICLASGRHLAYAIEVATNSLRSGKGRRRAREHSYAPSRAVELATAQ